METYVFLQHYWWAVVSLLGAILVFLLFVQGGNSLLFCVGKDDVRKQLVINSTGRKWEFTFTTLVTFGGAFFASFPLFYSTSFGGAYWLWMIILFTFVLQAVSYEFQSKLGNLLGRKTYRIFLVINGVVGPILLGGAVATFFTGSNFIVDKGNLAELSMPVISGWANASHGLFHQQYRFSGDSGIEPESAQNRNPSVPCAFPRVFRENTCRGGFRSRR